MPVRSLILLAFPLIAALAQSPLKPAQSPAVSLLTYGELQDLIARDSGKVVLVNLWATWCKPCNEEMPDLIKLREAYGPKNFRLILVSADDSELVESTVRPRLQKLGVTFSSYIANDRSGDAFLEKIMPADWNGALALPTSFIYDRTGKLSDMLVGGQTLTAFRKAVNKALRTRAG